MSSSYQHVQNFELESDNSHSSMQFEGAQTHVRDDRTSSKSTSRTIMIALVVAFLLTIVVNILSASAPLASTMQSKKGSICDAPTYSQTTLKTAYENSFIAMMKDTKGQKKFEASDIIMVDNDFYAVCDNSWAIEKISKQLIPFSESNVQIGNPSREKEDSGFEAIFHDAQTNLFYVVRESVLLATGSEEDSHRKEYHAVVEEIRLLSASLYGTADYTVQRKCVSEFLFAGDSKGFEGALGLRSSLDGELYMLGLCEGNHCAEGKRGRDKGNGRIVILRLKEFPLLPGGGGEGEGEFPCAWVVHRTIDIPASARFQDYSAISIRSSDGTVAITSQEESQVWIGKLSHYNSLADSAKVGGMGTFNPDKSELLEEGAVVYDFPRDTNCEVVYCNIEGIHWVNDQLLVGVSDKMKKGGKQDFRCLEKDQSIHVFVLP